VFVIDRDFFWVIEIAIDAVHTPVINANGIDTLTWNDRDAPSRQRLVAFGQHRSTETQHGPGMLELPNRPSRTLSAQPRRYVFHEDDRKR